MTRRLIASFAVAASAIFSTPAAAQALASGSTLADSQTPQTPPPGQGMGRGTGNTPASTSGRELQAFAVTLVVADMRPDGSQDDLPAAARRALSDVRDFLPYKSYRLVDAQWIRGQGTAETRIKGVDQQEYSLHIGASQVSPRSGGLNVRFRLRDVASPPRAGNQDAIERMMLKREQLLEQRKDLRARVDVGTEKESALRAVEREIEVLQLELEQAKQAGGRETTSIMDASFSMTLDETVVVGTSRIKGDKALIALLTAVGTKSSGAREP